MEAGFFGRAYLLTGDSLNVTLENVLNYVDNRISAVKVNVGLLDEKVDALAEKLGDGDLVIQIPSEIDEKLAIMDAKIDESGLNAAEIDEKVAAAELKVLSIGNEIATSKVDFNEKIARLESKIDEIHIPDFADDFAEFDEKISAVNQKIDNLTFPNCDEEISAVNERIDNLKIPNYDAQIARLDSKIDEIHDWSDEIAAVNQKIDDIQIPSYDEDIARLEERIDSAETPDFSDEFARIDARIDAIEIPDYNSEIDRLDSRIDNIETPDFSADFARIDAKIDALPDYDSEIARLDARINGIEVPDFKNEISALKLKLNDLETRDFADEFSDIDAKITELDADVTEIDADVEQLFGDLDELNSRLDSMKSGEIYSAGYGLSLANGEFSVTLDTQTYVAGENITIDGGTIKSANTTYSTFETGENGLVPAPQVGDNEKFLRGDGTWSTVSSSSSGGGGYVIGSKVSTIEGGLWRDSINDVPVLKLRHGDYEYNFNYDNLTYLGGESSPIATVPPDTYVLGTDFVSTEGGLWYEVTNDVPTLNLHAGNFKYGFKFDSITYKGDNSHLVSYLPFDVSTTADACGNKWTAGDNPTITDGKINFNGSSCLTNSTISDSIGSSPWTIDFYGSCIPFYQTFFGTFDANQGVKDSTSWLICEYNNGNPGINCCGTTQYVNLSLENGSRHHFAMTYDGTNLKLYVDGILGVILPYSNLKLGGDFIIGASSTFHNYLKGTIDHFRIWNRCLWTSDFTPPTAADYR